MALFGSSRYISFFHVINTELIHNIIEQNINLSYVIEYNNNIIGILLYGMIVPCDSSDIDNLEVINNTYKDSDYYIKQINGITMLCIHPDFRNKGLATKLINLYLSSLLNFYNLQENKVIMMQY